MFSCTFTRCVIFWHRLGSLCGKETIFYLHMPRDKARTSGFQVRISCNSHHFGKEKHGLVAFFVRNRLRRRAASIDLSALVCKHGLRGSARGNPGSNAHPERNHRSASIIWISFSESAPPRAPRARLSKTTPLSIKTQ